jgi:hypothetical protein
LLGYRPVSLALGALAVLDPHRGAFGEMLQHDHRQVGAAPRAEVALPQDDIRTDALEGQCLAAPGAHRNRVITTVQQEQGSLVRHQHDGNPSAS